jgi:hypothetical protein
VRVVDSSTSLNHTNFGTPANNISINRGRSGTITSARRRPHYFSLDCAWPGNGNLDTEIWWAWVIWPPDPTLSATSYQLPSCQLPAISSQFRGSRRAKQD